jgi:hypothetical protein
MAEIKLKEIFSWHLTLRYLLGMIMLAYGLIKVFQIQFILPADAYELQLKQLDGVTLTWAFLGFSSWFRVLLGIFEIVPAILLLFARTKLLGAILLFPSLLTVFIINNAYGFLPYMRIFTGVLLSINLLLIIPHRKILLKIFKESVTPSSTVGFGETILNVVIAGLIIFLILYNFQPN